MWWQVLKPAFTDEDGLNWTVRLTDAQDYTWSEAAGLGYTPSQWQPGDDIISAFNLDIPVDAPPGAYQVRLQLSVKGTTAVFRGSEGSDLASLALGTVQVTRGPVPITKPDLPVRYPSKAKFGDSIQLIGSDAVGNVSAGEAWRLVLFWKANSAIQDDYRIRLQATNESGELIAESDEALVAPAYPTHLWRTGDYVRTVQDLNFPANAPSAKVTVRVFLVGRDGRPVGRADGVPVAGIEIGGRAHNLVRPSPAHPQIARFGNDIGLVGYDLSSETIRAGAPISVTLYWQSRGPEDKAYTVFVHLLDSRGIVIGQEDSQPLQGAARTDTWQAGEFIADGHNFTIVPNAPRGPAALEFGLYDSATGIRLPAYDESGKPIGDRELIEGLVIAQ